LAVEPGELIDVTDSARIVDEKPKTAIADKIAAKANETNEPDQALPATEPESPEEPQQTPEYRDVDSVIAAFREAGDKQTLEGMIGLMDEVEPGFKGEVTREFERLLLELGSQSSPVQPPKDDDNDDLEGRMQGIVVGLTGDVSAEVAGELFGDGRKKRFLVRELDKFQLVKLESILGKRGLIPEDE
jgi:hypothetical protein